MTINFEHHVDAGSPLFSSDGDLHSILCEDGDQGRLIGVYSEPILPGAEIRFRANASGPGNVIITWTDEIQPWKEAGDDALNLHFGAIDTVVTVPEGRSVLRIELRSKIGGSEFVNVIIGDDGEPPPVEPPEGDFYHVYQLPTPDLQYVWVVTISDRGITTTRVVSSIENEYLDELQATEPEEPAELLLPGNWDDWEIVP